jgi:antitoxin VapB
MLVIWAKSQEQFRKIRNDAEKEKETDRANRLETTQEFKSWAQARRMGFGAILFRQGTALQQSLFWHMSLAYANGSLPMTEQRHVRLFRNGRNQAVRIPVEFELPGNEAIMHRDGDRLVIEPVRKRGLIALLKTMKPIEESFPEIDDPVPAPERAL